MVGMAKNGLEMLNKLCPKGVMDSKTMELKGPVDQGMRKLSLNTKAIQDSVKEGAHDSSNVATREGCSNKGIFNCPHDGQI